MPAGGLVTLGIGGIVANLFGARHAANAARQAAQQQQQAIDKAQGIAKDVYGEQKAALQPYQDFGQYGLKNFMRTYGNQTPQDFASRVQGFTNAARYNAPMANQGLPQQGQQYSMANLQQPGGGGMQERGPELPQPQGGGMVMVQDDTGATRQVPQAQADLYRQHGFKVMG